jgi:hypothetical protein
MILKKNSEPLSEDEVRKLKLKAHGYAEEQFN